MTKLAEDLRGYCDIDEAEGGNATVIEDTWKAADLLDSIEGKLRAIVARSNNDPLGSSKVGDMRALAEEALTELEAA